MATSPVVNIFDRPSSPPHLISFVLQSKKALQHGEQLCSHVHDVTYNSARQTVAVLALDAKIRWITEGVLNQLNVAAGVSKNITERRVRLEGEAKQWDRVRLQHQEALDVTLESLGTQVVPPSFHQSSLESSLFGIQAAEGIEDPDEKSNQTNEPPLANETRHSDRNKWKTLRDFVDERGLEDVIESIEEERNVLDETLAAMAAHPATITSMITRIRALLSDSLTRSKRGSMDLPQIHKSIPYVGAEQPSPVDLPLTKNLSALLTLQERASAEMASHLESLATHYDQMATALKEKEAGGDIGEEDMEVFVRDTAELPSIIAELEESMSSVESVYQEIVNKKDGLQSSLTAHSRILDSLDFLGDTMEMMLREQSGIEVETQATYETLNDYLDSLLTLRSTYETYQMSYNALVVEMDRRKRYQDAMELVVQEMREKLGKLRNDEIIAREAFYAAHSESIPDDLCLAISNLPPSFVISSDLHDVNAVNEGGHGKEVLPEIEDDLLLEARRRLEAAPTQPQHVRNVTTPVRPGPRREDSL